MSNNNDIDKAYVSPYDKFLFEFDATHKKSASQQQEIEKNQRIAHLRDHAKHKDEQGEIWDAF
ncbi:CBU_0585 family protein [Legionella fairfieldensis]|uniref:CBU_0585 family protein n=1 Tax=Legionella fairfieldensis TaxID=45064 RepID=UPI00055AF998|nr:CBU_0585 family protein [Legionella fairfieldensis]